MKKILIFSLSYYPHVGGAEIAIKEITDRIDPSEIAFHLICNRVDGALPRVEKLGNVMVHRVGFGSLLYFAKIAFVPLAAWKALVLQRTEHFDGFWAMMSYMVFPIVLLRMVGVRVPYILTLQDGDPFEHVFKRWHIRPFAPLLRRGFRNARIVQSISTYLAEWARALGYHGPLEVIPNGVEVQRFLGESVPHEGVILITTSRLVYKNAIDDVIRALVWLPDARFLVLGTGREENALKKLAHECGVADRVEFVGHVDNKDLSAYLHKADIFLRPSRSEGFGISFIEAMATGVPVISTQVGGIADFLFDPERNPDKAPTGRAVEPNDPKGIARAVLLYLEEKDIMKRIVENARNMALEKYDWERIVQDMQTRVFSPLLGI